MPSSPEVLDVVALLVDVPEYRLVKGQVGTVVESLSSYHVEVEFVDEQGKTYAQLPLHINQLMTLHYHPVAAA